MEISARYTPFYCEENVWWLAQSHELAAFERWVVFVSNPPRTCALWSQRASARSGEPVIWDYHVVLLVGRGGWEVWDLDCVEGCPLSARRWSEVTFPYGFGGADFQVKPAYAPYFRLIDADQFVKSFRSDRAHMRDPISGAYLQPPPSWGVLSPGENNLELFVETDSQKLAFEGTSLLDWSGWLARTQSG